MALVSHPAAEELPAVSNFLQRHSAFSSICSFCEHLRIEVMSWNPAHKSLRKLGKGVVLKLAFWPQDDSFPMLIERLTFVVNATGKQHEIHLKTICADRISLSIVKPITSCLPTKHYGLNGVNSTVAAKFLRILLQAGAWIHIIRYG